MPYENLTKPFRPSNVSGPLYETPGKHKAATARSIRNPLALFGNYPKRYDSPFSKLFKAASVVFDQ